MKYNKLYRPTLNETLYFIELIPSLYIYLDTQQNINNKNVQ